MTTQQEILLKTSKEFPDKRALSFFKSTLTYSDLYRYSAAVASQLSEYVRVGDTVAILMQNIPQFVMVQHAVWMLGCSILPMNPSYSAREIKYCLIDSGAKLVIAQSDALSRVKEASSSISGIKVLATNPTTFSDIPSHLFEKWGFSECSEELDFRSSSMTPISSTPSESLAILVYTSGTTGNPKGAMVSHKNIYSSASIYKKWFKFTQHDSVLGFSPFFHITGLVFHLATALLAGSHVVMGGRFDSELVLDSVEKEKTTVTMMAATAYISLLNNSNIHQTDMSSMRLWSSGGMPVSRRLEETWKDLTNSWIYVAWGLTETTSPATLWPYPYNGPLPVDGETGIVSSGIPVYDTSLKIVDDNRAELPEGRVGEIAVKGPQVVSGYLNKPEANKETFTDGWLYTGDIAKIERGWVFIIDRKKDMINSSGFKVWPREVEEVLYMHPCVSEAAVVGVEDSYRGETVKAFIKLNQDCQNSEAVKNSIVEHCKRYLAPYKVPRQIEFIQEIPKTLSGKILKRVLKDRSSLSQTSS
ncbi:MAG: AMP-binding protein [Conexivisphaerales archaeon]